MVLRHRREYSLGSAGCSIVTTHHQVSDPAIFGIIRHQLPIRDIRRLECPHDAIREPIHSTLHVEVPIFPVRRRVANVRWDRGVERDENVEQVLDIQ